MSVVSILLALIFLVVVGVNFRAGIWACAIQLIAVLFSAVIATSLFEVVGRFIEGTVGSLWQYGDMIGAWLVFALVLFAITYLSTLASTTAVRFPKSADQAGGLAISLLTGWIFICFTAMTLHVAPLPRDAFFGSFAAEQPMFFGYQPDWAWLGFAQKTSLGVYSAGNPFDPEGDFVIRNVAKRERFEMHQPDPASPSNFVARNAVAKGK